MLVLLLALVAGCTGEPVAQPASHPPVTGGTHRPTPTPTPTVKPTRHTTVLAVASQADAVRLLVMTCGKACHEVLLTSTDTGASFTAPRSLPGPSTAYSGMALGPHGAVVVWSTARKVVMWSKDDGRTWKRSAPLALADVVVLGDSVWAITQGCKPVCADRILSGRVGTSPATWKPLALLPRPALALSRVSALTSFALADGVKGTALLTTRNGGATWTSLAAPCLASGEGSVSAVDAKVVWLMCGPRGRVQSSYLSRDGGRHWTGPFVAGPAGRVHALSAARAYATGERTAILTTIDGGRHWRTDTDYEEGFGPLAQTASGTLLSAVLSEKGSGSGTNGSVWRRPKGGPWTVQVIARAG